MTMNSYGRLRKLGNAKVNVTLSVKGLVDLVQLANKAIDNIKSTRVVEGGRNSEIAAEIGDYSRGGLEILTSMDVVGNRQVQSYLLLSKKLR